MSQTSAVIRPYPVNSAFSSWISAYVRFLVSRDESLLLKVAPLALIGVLPMDIVSNLIPGIGFLDDAGYIVIATVVLYKTLTRVNHYRRRSVSPPSRPVAAP